MVLGRYGKREKIKMLTLKHGIFKIRLRNHFRTH